MPPGQLYEYIPYKSFNLPAIPTQTTATGGLVAIFAISVCRVRFRFKLNLELFKMAILSASVGVVQAAKAARVADLLDPERMDRALCATSDQ